MTPEAKIVIAAMICVVITIMFLIWIYGIYRNTKSMCLSNLTCYQLYKEGVALKAAGNDPKEKYEQALLFCELELKMPASKHLSESIYELMVHLKKVLGIK